MESIGKKYAPLETKRDFRGKNLLPRCLCPAGPFQNGEGGQNLPEADTSPSTVFEKSVYLTA